MSAKHTTRVLFVGNSYTHRGPVPLLVHMLASCSEQPFLCYAIAPEAATLNDHSMSDEVEHAMRFGRWDALVMQVYSTRPTQNAGDPDAFCEDVLSLGKMFHEHNPNAKIWLQQPWARHPDYMAWLPNPRAHFYPNQFASPAEMLAQLTDGLQRATQLLRQELPASKADTIWVGDRWHAYDQQCGAVTLHDSDGNHADKAGQWLTAIVLFEALFGHKPTATPELGIHPSILSFCGIEAI